MVGDTRWVGGHDWFAVGGGWVVKLYFYSFTMFNAA